MSASNNNSNTGSSLWNQWISGTGWFGPLVQLTPEEEAAKEEQRRRAKEASVHTYREPTTPSKQRPGLMHRLSSAVELSSYWRSPTKEPQQANVQEEEQHVVGEDEGNMQQQPTTDRGEQEEVAVRRK